MLQLGTHSACIIVDGVELPQYSIEHSTHKGRPLITCWIASEAGKEFSIRFEDKASTFDSIGDIMVDDISCDTLRLYAGQRTRVELKTARVSATSARPFMFSHIRLTDEEHDVNHAASRKLGEIKLQICKAKLKKTKMKTKTRGQDRMGKLVEAAKVHERSKKAIGHHVRLGEEITIPKLKYHVSITEVQILGVLIFKYRPLDMLQANGIAPLDKKRKRAVSLPDEENAVSESDAEDARRIEVLEAELRALKNKLQARDTKKPKREVKEEVDICWLPGEVIDLT
ncbi:hypothetical protein BDZ94DRAFT_1257780 [Collybia nuda]|uniref:DUF7918 domain-containing protein n=1 Tax=Collybia nuda TaxID=64659 RepID=A0A9P6CJ36_9AGAR|nr:hypothetical protein BDZ94DRAFT_1257780 [Collybia nuda]